MSRLIDADALADASCSGGVCAECDDMYGGNNVVTNCSEVRFRFLKLINDAPTIEPKKGKWNCSDDYYETGVCSVCEWDVGEAYADCKKWFKYCPNCGARMER